MTPENSTLRICGAGTLTEHTMRVRAIKDLTQLAEPEFFSAIAEGLNLIVKNVTKLWDAAALLSKEEKGHPARVLAIIAEEEAAKALILIDAVRCPKLPADRFANQLGRFNDHLAKGLYAKGYMLRAVTLADLQAYINLDRKEFYLDGPNDVDWIFRNEVIQRREGALYVDYVASDEEKMWFDPSVAEDLGLNLRPPKSVSMVQAFYDAGFFRKEALEAVAEIWRPSPPAMNTHFQEIRKLSYSTLKSMESRGLLEHPSSIYSWLLDEWQFPMYDLDLSEITVSRDALREQQNNWNPSWL